MKRRYDDPEERRKRQESRYIGMVKAAFKVCKRTMGDEVRSVRIRG